MFAGDEKIKYNAKKKTYGFKERDEEKRKAYVAEIANYNKKSLIYLDEAGIDATESYPYAWSEKGKRAWSKKSGKRYNRLNFIGALKGKQFMAPFIFNGYCDSALFEVYIERCLLPELTPGDIVIADNAAFHKSPNVRYLIESKDCKLIFLPAYSPDLNPIEHQWFPIKNRIRQLLDKGETLAIAAERVLRESSESIW